MENKKISVFLTDDHPIFRNGLKSLLTEEEDVEIVGEASDASQLLDFLEHTLPDVVVLDITLPGMSGIEATKQITMQFGCVAVLILSMHEGADYILSALEAGAKGYLPKDVEKSELVSAIKTIASGGEYFSRSISATMMKGLVQQKKMEAETAPLTLREKEILALAASGVSNRDIAEKLFISPRTVDCHKNHIMQKLELKTTAELILYAIRNKIIEL
jgi:DNA-binding NarL/FixJ family response regulator